MNGVLRFSLVKQRNGQKYTVKMIKVHKDYSFRDNIASLVLKVCADNFSSVLHIYLTEYSKWDHSKSCPTNWSEFAICEAHCGKT